MSVWHHHRQALSLLTARDIYDRNTRLINVKSRLKIVFGASVDNISFVHFLGCKDYKKLTLSLALTLIKLKKRRNSLGQSLAEERMVSMIIFM